MIDLQEDFFHFVRSLPWQEIVVSFVCLVCGALAHWVKKAAAKEVPWNIWEYCFQQHPGRTLMLAGGLAVAWWGLVTGANSYSTWPAFITAAVTLGWVANSALNKGAPPEQTHPKEKNE